MFISGNGKKRQPFVIGAHLRRLRPEECGKLIGRRFLVRQDGKLS
jgi:hypothetical protein